MFDDFLIDVCYLCITIIGQFPAAEKSQYPKGTFFFVLSDSFFPLTRSLSAVVAASVYPAQLDAAVADQARPGAVIRDRLQTAVTVCFQITGIDAA